MPERPLGVDRTDHVHTSPEAELALLRVDGDILELVLDDGEHLRFSRREFETNLRDLTGEAA